MKLLFVAAEVSPYAKVGGLADVIGSLPKSLAKLGHEIKIVMPLYQQINLKQWKLKKFIDHWVISNPLSSLQTHFDAYRTYLPESHVEVIFIANAYYFQRPGIYMENGNDYVDNAERYAFLCKAAMALVQGMDWRPDIIHCHDWQTALLPAYQKLYYMGDSFWKGIKTVFTIHNLAYQGIYGRDKLFSLGLPEWTFQPRYLEFYGNLCLMKAGLVFSDKLTTVSPRYAQEIQDSVAGFGLDGVLRDRQADLTGILNGIDYSEWNSKQDKELAASFSTEDMTGKKLNKQKLLEENGLSTNGEDIPVIGIVSRLVDQKGFDLIAEAAGQLLSLNLKLILLGTGEVRYHSLCQWLQNTYPDKIKVHLKFDGYTAKMIYAGSDFFLMPSKFEPCGLSQLIAMAYGTIPIVRSTGGLADSVFDFDLVSKQGNGLVFYEYEPSQLVKTVERALDFYSKKALWTVLQKNAFASAYSWESSARQYEALYQKLCL